jgi:mRNA interferase RelE/StbE
MTYELRFHPAALKEWKKLNPEIQRRFKEQLKRRLDTPRVEAHKLKGDLSDYFKIKLRSSGYRLVYFVEDKSKVLTVLAVGKRENSIVYETSKKRK